MVFLVTQDGGFPGFDKVAGHFERVVLEIVRRGVLRAVDFGMNILRPANVCSVIVGTGEGGKRSSL